MAVDNDFLTNVQRALVKVLKSDSILKQYNWEDWDSNQIVRLPRGTIKVGATGDLNFGNVWTVRPEISMEGKPKRQKLSAVMGELQKTVTAANLHTLLNEASAGKVKFYQRGEEFDFQQETDGDIRRRTVAFSISAAPLV